MRSGVARNETNKVGESGGGRSVKDGGEGGYIRKEGNGLGLLGEVGVGLSDREVSVEV